MTAAELRNVMSTGTGSKGSKGSFVQSLQKALA
jgi:hypothetical protein